MGSNPRKKLPEQARDFSGRPTTAQSFADPEATGRVRRKGAGTQRSEAKCERAGAAKKEGGLKNIKSVRVLHTAPSLHYLTDRGRAEKIETENKRLLRKLLTQYATPVIARQSAIPKCKFDQDYPSMLTFH